MSAQYNALPIIQSRHVGPPRARQDWQYRRNSTVLPVQPLRTSGHTQRSTCFRRKLWTRRCRQHATLPRCLYNKQCLLRGHKQRIYRRLCCVPVVRMGHQLYGVRHHGASVSHHRNNANVMRLTQDRLVRDETCVQWLLANGANPNM